MANDSIPEDAIDGYSIPVYGIEDGSFYYLHIPAIICIVMSFTCVTIALVLSFRKRSYRTFFTSWSKSEKFVVYLAICDGLFNVSHVTDHTYIVVVQDMVKPKALCIFYAFILAVFVTAQNLMVNVVAINAFMLIFFDKNLNFGRYDWKLLLWTFGAPFVGAVVAGAAGQLGPNGAFCYFDGINGNVTNLLFTTVPLLVILVMNSVLYIMTWYRIRRQCNELKQSLGKMSANMRASHRAARAMSMFVAAFFVQWWALAVYGIWGLVDDVPGPVFNLVVTFSNIGGVLNLVVLMLIRRKQLSKGETAPGEKSGDSDNKKSYTKTVTTSDHVSLSDITSKEDSGHSNDDKPQIHVSSSKQL